MIQHNSKDCNTFFDVFAGTGVVTAAMLNYYTHFIINDFLYSNEVIYKAFFLQKAYKCDKLKDIVSTYNELNRNLLHDNYVSENYGNKYFNIEDAKLIGHIRDDIELKFRQNIINEKEYYILLASLLYSFDKIANTCGHYDAFFKNKMRNENFIMKLINPIYAPTKEIEIYREDANKLVRNISADIVFIDPPYNSRQYSRFYHVLENIVKWDKPNLYGIAMKPIEENMSEYCKNNAVHFFSDLIENINAKYIAVTYNNTYLSKSSSSKNKMILSDIEEILKNKGITNIFEISHNYFNTGKTNFSDHKEFLFITEVFK